MANNKVQLSDGTVLIDLTDATATADKIMSGYTAYGASGVKLIGTASGGGGGGSIYQDENGYLVISPDGDGGSINLQSKTVVPTTSAQIVVADSGYDGLSEVTVEPIPSSYIIPSGTLSITSNGTYDVASYASANINVSGGGSTKETEIITRTISGTYENSSATKVGEYAFAGCVNLKAVVFPSATEIGGSAFNSCTTMTSVSFPAVTSIGSSAFYYCKSLSAANFPSVTSVGSSAFYSCTSLAVVNFPVATTIYPTAFARCNKLTTISDANFPVISSIGAYAFQYCSGLQSVNLTGAKSLGASAFAMASSLNTVSFQNVTSIGNYAFYSCSRLQSAYFLGSSVPSLGNSAFAYTPMERSSYIGGFGSIFVASSMLASFQSATNWATFSARMVGLTDAQIEALE